MEYRGGGSVAIQPEEFSFDIEAGWSRTVSYLGTHQGIRGLIGQYEAGGYTFTADFNGPIARISGTINQNPVNPNDVEAERYTTHTEVIDQDIWTLEGLEAEAAAYAAAEGVSPSKYRAVILQAVKDAKLSDLAANDLPAGSYPLAYMAYTELARGADSFENQVVVLTRSRVVPIAWIGRLDMDTVSRIYSGGGMIATFGLNPAVSGLFPAVPSTIAPNSVWGWRRRRQSIDYLEDGVRANIVQDWTFAQWSTFIYEQAV